MAEWNKGKVLPSAINGGQEFTKKDNLAINELNAIVNNSFYASEIAEDSISKSDNAMNVAVDALQRIDKFIQTEGNSVVTLDGVPQVTWSADFAESERQKSKNLFKVNNNIGHSVTRGGVTATINDDYTITLNGTCTSNTWWNIFAGISSGSNFSNDYKKFYLDSNKSYTGLIQHISGTASSTEQSILWYSFRQTNGTTATASFDKDFYNPNLNNSSVNITNVNYLNNGFFATRQGVTYTNFRFGIMICEGIDTDYQPYNGAIVHEKQLNEAVEKRQILNSWKDYISITQSELTTLKEYFNLFCKSHNICFLCRIGNAETSNFKTLVGVPSGFGNYVTAYIRRCVVGSNEEKFTTFEVFAENDFGYKTAKSYIWKNSDGAIVFSGWTVIGG